MIKSTTDVAAAARDNSRALRDTLGAFATGVTVVSTLDDAGEPWGFTANSFTSVSLDPPLILVCLGRRAESCAVFAQAQGFAVSILSTAQRALSQRFASPRPGKFDTVAWSPQVTGSPVVEGAVGWLDCEREQVLDGGDHIIIIGRVVAFRTTEREPLTYCRGVYGTFSAVSSDEPPADV